MKSYLVVITLFLLLISLFACTIKKFEAPEFDKKIKLPLINKSYYISDLTDTTDDYIIANENDTMQFSIIQDIEAERIGDSLRIDTSSHSFSKKLGTIKVNGTGESKAGIGMLSAMDAPSEIHNQIIPPFSSPIISSSFSSFENNNIQYVVIDSGFAYVTLINNTEIPLSSNDSTHYMSIEIYGNEVTPENLILSYRVEHLIAPRDSEETTINLAGQTVYQDNILNGYITSDGTGTTPVNVLEQDSLIVKFSVSDMKIREGRAKLPEQHIGKREAISIVDTTGEIELQSAEIDSCICNTLFQNYLPINAHASIIFDELFDYPEHHYQLDAYLHTDSPFDTLFNFSGIEINGGTEILDSLHFDFHVYIEPSDTFVTVSKDDSVSATVNLGEVKFRGICGNINNKRFNMDNIAQDIDIDIPDSLQGLLEFQNVELLASINNGIGFGCAINARITGYNGNTGNSATVVIDNQHIAADAISNITITEGVADLINIIPDSISVDSLYVIIDGENGCITKDDSVSGSFTIWTPLRFIINDKSGIRPDSVEHVEMEEDDRNKIENNLNNVKLSMTVENSFPFGAGIKVYFATEEDSVYEKPNYMVDSLQVDAAHFDGSGCSCDTTSSELIIDLGSDAIDVFTNPDVYIGVEFSTVGTNGKTVIIRGNDNIRVKGYIEVDAHISDSLWED